MGKIGKSNNDFSTDTQRLTNNAVDFFYLLHTLIQNHVIEGIIGIFLQAVFNIVVKNTQAFLDAFLNGFLTQFDSLCRTCLSRTRG